MFAIPYWSRSPSSNDYTRARSPGLFTTLYIHNYKFQIELVRNYNQTIVSTLISIDSPDDPTTSYTSHNILYISYNIIVCLPRLKYPVLAYLLQAKVPLLRQKVVGCPSSPPYVPPVSWGGGKHNPVCFAIQDSALAIADLLILIACIHISPPCLFLFFSSEHHLHWSPHPLEPCIASLLHHPSFRSCFQGPLEHVHCYDRCTGA